MDRLSILSCLLVAVTDGLRISSSKHSADCTLPNKVFAAWHHVHSTKVWEQANRLFQPKLTKEQESLLVDAPKLFCATWVRPAEDGGTEPWVSEIHRMHEGCDGHGVFSNFTSQQEGIIKTLDGPTGKNVRSMIEFSSIYRHLADDALAKKYDWFVILESDHFIQPLVWKQALAEETASGEMPNGAVLLRLKNVFAVNQAMLQEMKKQEATLGKVTETGCPAWTPWAQCTDCHHYGNCQADISTPLIPATMENGTATLYNAGRLAHFSKLGRRPCATMFIEMRTLCEKFHGEKFNPLNWDNPDFQVDMIQQVASTSHEGLSLDKSQEAPAYRDQGYTRAQDIAKKTLEDINTGKIEVTPRQAEALKMMLH